MCIACYPISGTKEVGKSPILSLYVDLSLGSITTPLMTCIGSISATLCPIIPSTNERTVGGARTIIYYYNKIWPQPKSISTEQILLSSEVST
jgi:hypothetical protein